MRKLAINFALGGVLAVALLWFVQAELLADVATADQTAWQALWSAVTSLPGWAVPTYAVLFIAVHLIRVWRWVLQVRPLGETDSLKVFRVCAVGYAAIVLFPFRLGELVRPYLLSRVSDRVGFSEAMGTAVVERIFDGLFITGLLFLAVATAPEAGSATIRHAGQVSLAVFSSAAFGLMLFAWRRADAERLLGWSFGLLDAAILKATGRDIGLQPKITSLLVGFVEGVGSLRSSGAFPTFVALTVAYWSVNAFGIWVLAQAFGIPLPLVGGFGLLAVLVVGIMVPSAPGFLGTFQFFISEGLKLYVPLGAFGAVALAFALVMNIVQLVLQVGFAVPFFAGLNLKFADLFRLQQEATREGGAEA